MATRIVSILLGSALLLCALAASASAAATPECAMAEFWDRPGIERSHRLSCERAWTVELAAAPAHGRLSGFAYDADAQVATWRYRPEAGAPAEDGFTLRLEGPNGVVTQPVKIHVTPREQNTAPQCQPVSEARRTDGTAPAVVELRLTCWDYEHDSFTLDGGGPGEHLDGPRAVPGGDGGGSDAPAWRYRTATASGQEATSFWATDDLGARSSDTPLSVQVGPGIDRLPECVPNPGYADPSTDYLAILARPGATRRFGIVCSDADHDAIGVSLGQKPARGAITTFDPEAQRDGERWIDAVYRPAGGSREPDPFTVVASARGRATETKMAIADADGRWVSGLGCSTKAGQTTAGSPGLVSLSCLDAEGDELRAAITRAPAHGVASAPLRSPGRFGWDDIAVAWTPEPGFVGIDTLGLRVTDGHGVQVDLEVNLYSYAPDAAPAAATLAAAGQPSVGQAKPVAPVDQARAALRARDVVLVRRIGDARVFARRAAVRRGVAPRTGSTALAVTCPLTCRVAARVQGARAARLGRTTATPARAARLKLSRRAAGLLKASGAVALELSARVPDGRSGRGTVRLRRR